MSRNEPGVLVSVTLTIFLWRRSLVRQSGLATAVLAGCVAAACANDPTVALRSSGDALVGSTASAAPAAPSLQEASRPTPFPPLTKPVNDFADVIDPAIERAIEALIHDVQRRTGDVLVVVTLPTCVPFTTLRDCSLEVFDNHGNGIGQAGRDNGVLLLAAMAERELRITTGYGIERVLTEATATAICDEMTPWMARRDYGQGLLHGAQRIAATLLSAGSTDVRQH